MWLATYNADNGTNFVGGHNEICELVTQIDKGKVEVQTSN